MKPVSVCTDGWQLPAQRLLACPVMARQPRLQDLLRAALHSLPVAADEMQQAQLLRVWCDATLAQQLQSCTPEQLSSMLACLRDDALAVPRQQEAPLLVLLLARLELAIVAALEQGSAQALGQALAAAASMPADADGVGCQLVAALAIQLQAQPELAPAAAREAALAGLWQQLQCCSALQREVLLLAAPAELLLDLLGSAAKPALPDALLERLLAQRRSAARQQHWMNMSKQMHALARESASLLRDALQGALKFSDGRYGQARALGRRVDELVDLAWQDQPLPHSSVVLPLADVAGHLRLLPSRLQQLLLQVAGAQSRERLAAASPAPWPLLEQAAMPGRRAGLAAQLLDALGQEAQQQKTDLAAQVDARVTQLARNLGALVPDDAVWDVLAQWQGQVTALGGDGVVERALNGQVCTHLAASLALQPLMALAGMLAAPASERISAAGLAMRSYVATQLRIAAERRGREDLLQRAERMLAQRLQHARPGPGGGAAGALELDGIVAAIAEEIAQRARLYGLYAGADEARCRQWALGLVSAPMARLDARQRELLLGSCSAGLRAELAPLGITLPTAAHAVADDTVAAHAPAVPSAPLAAQAPPLMLAAAPAPPDEAQAAFNVVCRLQLTSFIERQLADAVAPASRVRSVLAPVLALAAVLREAGHLREEVPDESEYTDHVKSLLRARLGLLQALQLQGLARRLPAQEWRQLVPPRP